MFFKFKFLTALLSIVFVVPSTIISQDATVKVADLKFKLSDFKNPNEFLQRPGLLRFSPEGELLAVSGRSTDIIIYDTKTGEIRSKIDGKGYNAFSFLPGGTTALARDNDFQLRVFDLADGKMLRELKGIVAAADDGTPFVSLDPNSGLEMQPIDLSPDKKKVLTVKGTRRWSLVDFESGNLLYDFRNPDKSRAGVMLLKAVYGFDNSFVTGLLTLKQETNFTSDGKYALVSNMSRTATLWNIETGELTAQIGPLENTIVGESFSPNGSLLATTDSEGITKIWSIPEGKLLSTIGSEKDSNYIAAWSPDNKLIWTIAFKEDARAYDAVSGKLVTTLSGSRASGVMYSPNGKLLLTKTATDKTSFATVWSAESSAVVARIPRNKKDEMPFRIFFDPTGNYIVSASRKDVKLWNTTGELLETLDNAVFPARFSSDGSMLVTGGKNNTGYLWQIRR